LHDFDSERTEQPGGTFRIGGHEFNYRAKVGADVLTRFFDAPEGISHECPHCHQSFQIGSLRPTQDVLAAADALILRMLTPGQEEAWRAVRSDDAENPLTQREVVDVANWLIGAITARPTEQQSGSSSTPATAGTNSTDGSPSLAAV
jgi:hypothetical protein